MQYHKCNDAPLHFYLSGAMFDNRTTITYWRSDVATTVEGYVRSQVSCV